MNETNTSSLPSDFDGIFRFTNFTKEEFKARWSNVEYTFPPESRTPMIIPSATPEEVQQIRKKFAKELAVKEFYKTPKFIGMNTISPGGIPALYTDSDLTPFIQKCLDPLPTGKATTKVMPPLLDEDRLHRDEDGEPVTEVVKSDKKRFVGKQDKILG